MKSIKEQRAAIASPIEFIETIKAEVGSGVIMAQDVIAKTLRLSDYPKLLDWAERARRVLCDVDEFVGESSIGAAASQLLEELPE